MQIIWSNAMYILSKQFVICCSNILSCKTGFLYRQSMPHFLLFIFSSKHILSISLLSRSVLRFAGKSDREFYRVFQHPNVHVIPLISVESECHYFSRFNPWKVLTAPQG